MCYCTQVEGCSHQIGLGKNDMRYDQCADRLNETRNYHPPCVLSLSFFLHPAAGGRPQNATTPREVQVASFPRTLYRLHCAAVHAEGMLDFGQQWICGVGAHGAITARPEHVDEVGLVRDLVLADALDARLLVGGKGGLHHGSLGVDPQRWLELI